MAAGNAAKCTFAAVVEATPTGAVPTCDSCGRAGEELAEVHRVYVTPAAWDTEERVEVVDEVEHWCFVCRSHYPHQPVGATEPEL